MVNQTIRKSRFLFFVLCGSILSVLVTGCGSGGNKGASVGNGIPFTCNNIDGNIAGCWASEICATESESDLDVRSDVPGVRQVSVFEQTETAPNFKGTIKEYLLTYDNDQCNGDPIQVYDVNEAAGLLVEYEEKGFSVCDDYYNPTVDENGVIQGFSCVDIDISLTIKASENGISSTDLPTSTGYTVYAIDDEDDRLCFAYGDYNYDNTANGGIGLPYALSESARPSNIDSSLGQCMRRISF